MARRAYRNNFLRHGLRSWLASAGTYGKGAFVAPSWMCVHLELTNMLAASRPVPNGAMHFRQLRSSSRYSRSITTGVAERLMHFDLECCKRDLECGSSGHPGRR